MTPSASQGRRVAAAVTVTCATVLAAGCARSAAPPQPGPTTTVTATVRPSAPASTPPPGGASGPASPPAGSAAPPPCSTSVLHAAIGAGDAAAGSSYFPIDLTNTSSAACTLFGYPGVSFVTGTGGSQIGAAATRASSPAKLITLAPGATGHATLQVVDAGNYPPSRCKVAVAHWLKIYPPGQFSALYTRFFGRTCAGGPKATPILAVQTVQPGAKGS
ncbi:MAG TPA: DUF4232 domain-containing protein [Streptosporangiaceae bacterium]